MNIQINLDNQNAEFWSELCGSSLALSLGISEINIENLNRFDIEYMKIYPYLNKYIDPSILRRKNIRDRTWIWHFRSKIILNWRRILWN